MNRPSYTKPSERFVAYYRVSTQEQGRSGLGLEAQRQAVVRLIKTNGNRIVAEFTEIESGRKNNRPELEKAVQFARDNDATLVIAKLDRLSRDSYFTNQLMHEGLKFVCADMPQANNFTIRIMAALAEYERELIVGRIKGALDAKKARQPNWKPGRPERPDRPSGFTDEERKKGRETMTREANENEEHRKAFHFIKPRRESGMSWQAIANELNREKYRTRKGKKFTYGMVAYLYKRFSTQEKES